MKIHCWCYVLEIKKEVLNETNDLRRYKICLPIYNRAREIEFYGGTDTLRKVLRDPPLHKGRWTSLHFREAVGSRKEGVFSSPIRRLVQDWQVRFCLPRRNVDFSERKPKDKVVAGRRYQELPNTWRGHRIPVHCTSRWRHERFHRGCLAVVQVGFERWRLPQGDEW